MLAELLAGLVHDYGGTRKEFAEAIGVTRTHLSHILRRDPPYTPGIETLLKIALVTNTSASDLLKAAGKADVAALIETLYGGPARARVVDPAVSQADRRFVSAVNALTRKDHRTIHYLVGRLTP